MLVQRIDWRYYMQYKKFIKLKNQLVSIINSVLSLGQSDFQQRIIKAAPRYADEVSDTTMMLWKINVGNQKVYFVLLVTILSYSLTFGSHNSKLFKMMCKVFVMQYDPLNMV